MMYKLNTIIPHIVLYCDVLVLNSPQDERINR